ncbi:MAG: CYTH domain-containing protein [Flavobacteriaceae bacterium]|jgi:adenylate cyclase|nr:CYTH domain-containing protein [Flavobacteriaceae bacterium]
MLEIERKFLVLSEDFKNDAIRKCIIAQGYLNSHPDRTVRIRIRDEKGFITVKGKSSKGGITRFEWETEIALDEAQKMLNLCEPQIIFKTRYEVPLGKHIFEVDIFEGVHTGLVVAEIELNCEDEFFEKPDWLGEEVTDDERYYNVYLSKNVYPFESL